MLYISTGNQTQPTMYVEKSFHTVLVNTDLKESKAIQVDTFILKDSQIQTYPVITRNIRIQCDLSLKTFGECSFYKNITETADYSAVSEDSASRISNIRRKSFGFRKKIRYGIGHKLIHDAPGH